MALVLQDRVKETTTTVGTGTFTLDGTSTGFVPFSVIGNGNETYYTAVDNTTGAWEVGIGTYNAGTLTRDTVLASSDGGTKVGFAAGSKDVFVAYPAEKAVTLDTPQTITDKTLVSATVTSGTINNTTIGATTPASGAFTTLVASGASLTSVNAGVALLTSATVTTLNATGASIASANIGNLQFTAASIASINAGVAVITNLSATSASIASMNASVALLTTATATNLTATGASIASANIGNLQFTAASIASINAGVAVITNLTATGASIASANVGNAIITAATVTGASIASANVGTAVITAATVTGASIASANVGTAVITTGTVTNLTSTSASVASINAAVALITTGTVTALTATGASVASANVGTAVVTGLTVTNASIASLNAGTATITNVSGTTLTISGDSYLATNSAAAVGIGTTSPVAGNKVDIRGNIGRVAPSTGTQRAAWLASNTGGDMYVGLDNSSGLNFDTGTAYSGVLWRSGANPICFVNNNTERMRIDGTGNVGIGKSPTTKLDVSGTITIATGNLTFSNTAQRITGDMSNATHSNRLLFQNSVTNGNTNVSAIPNGTSTISVFRGYGASDPTNAPSISTAQIGTTESRISSEISGTASYTPMTFYTNGSERMRLDTSGNLGIGTASPVAGYRLNVVNDSGNAQQLIRAGTNFNSTIAFGDQDSSTSGQLIYAHNGDYMAFNTNAAERMRIDSSGNVGIGGTAGADTKVNALGTYPTSGTVTRVFFANGTIPSGTTAEANGFQTSLNTQAAAFTLGSLFHFQANGGTFGASSAVTNQYGFAVASSLTGATNNYGFYSNIASGSNRWNFYANGTADNYFAGNVGIASTGLTNVRFRVKGTGTGSADYTIYGENSAATLLFYVRNDGVFNTGLAANSPYNLTTASAANCFINSDGALYRSTSSLRYKSDVADAAHGLAEVLKLRSVTYKAKNDGDTVFGGLIAEEVHDAGLTEFVSYDKEGRPDALHYGNMVALLVKAVQELKAELEALKAA